MQNNTYVYIYVCIYVYVYVYRAPVKQVVQPDNQKTLHNAQRSSKIQFSFTENSVTPSFKIIHTELHT